VLAMERRPGIFSYLLEDFRLNDTNNMEPGNASLDASSFGVLRFLDLSSEEQNMVGGIFVPCCTLDEIVPHRVQRIAIFTGDCNGAS
jgi:hypothetical protein